MAQWNRLPLAGGEFQPESQFTMRPDPNEGGAPAPEVRVIKGWEPFCKAKRPGDAPETNKRPEWTYNGQRGGGSQKVFTTWGTNDSGVLMLTDVPVGVPLRLEVDCSYSDKDGREGSGVALRVGVDLSGGQNVYVENGPTIWTRWHGNTAPEGDPGHWPIDQQDITRTLALEFVANRPDITLILRHANVHPGKDASAFWHEARLFQWGDDDNKPPPPPPPPGDLGAVVAELKNIVLVLQEIRNKL